MTGSARLALIACLAVALLLRALALQSYEGAYRPHGDEIYYLFTTQSILRGEGHLGSFRPPGYPFVLATLFSLLDELYRVRWAQVGLSLVTVTLTFRLAHVRFGGRAGLIAGMTVALAPALVHHAHFFWSESLQALLVIAFFNTLDTYDRNRRLGTLLFAGLLLGLTALVRETWALLTPVVLGWVVWLERDRGKDAFRRAALMGACVAATVLPWTIRNANVHGTFVLISNCRWFPIAMGNLTADTEDELVAHKRALKAEADPLDEIAAEEFWRGVALEAIVARQPAWILEKLVETPRQLFTLDNNNLRFIANGWIDGLQPGTARILLWTDAIGYVLVMSLGLVALWLTRSDPLKVLAVLAMLFTFAIHVIANAVPRFVIPFVPLLAVHVGWMLSGGAARATRWQIVGAVATLAAFLTCVGASWPAVSAVLASL